MARTTTVRDGDSPAQDGVTGRAAQAGSEVDGVFACTRKDRLMTRTGSPYLALELRDRTGSIQARAFRDADALAGRFERGDLVRVAGRVERFRDQLVVEVVDDRAGRARRRSGRAGALPAHGLPRPRRARRVPRAPGRAGVRPALPGAAGRAARRRRAPRGLAPGALQPGRAPRVPGRAARAHRRRGDAGPRAVQLHPRLNSDLLLTAAITHDLGRTREFTYGAEIGLTDEGRLLGHLVIGERMLSERSGVLDEERRLALLHCVLCHHGPSPRPGAGFAPPRRWRCTG